MNKIVKINDITYNIQVVLDYIVEKRIGGRRQHKVTITSPNLPTKKYFITDLEKELSLIEEELSNIKNTFSEGELLLKKLGYK